MRQAKNKIPQEFINGGRAQIFNAFQQFNFENFSSMQRSDGHCLTIQTFSNIPQFNINDRDEKIERKSFGQSCDGEIDFDQGGTHSHSGQVPSSLHRSDV